MSGEKKGLKTRAAEFAGNTVACLFQLLVTVVVAFFVLASCVSDSKHLLTKVGVWKSEPRNETRMRPPDPKIEQDMRLVASLGKMAEAAGLDLAKVRVAIVVDPNINAVTIGKDSFLLFEGLYKLSDEALDAVMAHEVSHATLDHGRKSSDLIGKVDKVTRVAGLIFGADKDAVNEASSWAVAVAFSPYSQQQEFEADRAAIELLKRTGRPLDAINDMCEALEGIAENGGSAGGGFLSTHPAIPDRVKHLRTNAKEIFGRLTKKQYAAGILSLLDKSESFGLLEPDLQSRVDSDGEEVALETIEKEDMVHLRNADLLVSRLSSIEPPSEIHDLHAKFIAKVKESREILKKRLDAAKRRDISGVEKCEIEREQFFERSLPFAKEFDSKMMAP